MVIKGTVMGKLENTVEGMEKGDQGYIDPYELKFSPNQDKYDVFLNSKAEVYPKRIDLGATLYVRRIGPGASDFEVDLDSVDKDHKWTPKKLTADFIKFGNFINIGQVDMF